MFWNIKHWRKGRMLRWRTDTECEVFCFGKIRNKWLSIGRGWGWPAAEGGNTKDPSLLPLFFFFSHIHYIKEFLNKKVMIFWYFVWLHFQTSGKNSIKKLLWGRRGRRSAGWQLECWCWWKALSELRVSEGRLAKQAGDCRRGDIGAHWHENKEQDTGMIHNRVVKLYLSWSPAL